MSCREGRADRANQNRFGAVPAITKPAMSSFGSLRTSSLVAMLPGVPGDATTVTVKFCVTEAPSKSVARNVIDRGPDLFRVNDELPSGS